MAYFAQIDNNGFVKRVIVADQDFINSGRVGDPDSWVETKKDRSQRKNYASVGYYYDRQKDAFIAPKPHSSWVLNDKEQWEAPVKLPENLKDGPVSWDEENQEWKKVFGGVIK